jgi:membrane carboxypeptidase/penicillin-binding protein PbpC
LKIETTGTANRYQWFKNNVPIAGANSATFSIPNLTVQDVGTYTLQVNNNLVPALTLQSHSIVVIADCGQVQSGSKPIINVEGASVFCGLEPVNTRLITPENANISAYQWFFNGIQISNSNRILAQDAGIYRVQIFTRDGCSLLSDEMKISVLPEYSVSLAQNQLTLQAIVTAGRQVSNYEWFLNDRIIPEATQGTYSPVEVGTYKVRVTDVNGCRSISNSLIVNVVSAEENIYEGEISVYPNPSTAIFYLELGQEKANKIQLFNAIGKYYNEKITPISAKKYQIDLGNQALGLYFIEIVTDKGKIVRKIVKE